MRREKLKIVSKEDFFKDFFYKIKDRNEVLVGGKIGLRYVRNNSMFISWWMIIREEKMVMLEIKERSEGDVFE